MAALSSVAASQMNVRASAPVLVDTPNRSFNNTGSLKISFNGLHSIDIGSLSRQSADAHVMSTKRAYTSHKKPSIQCLPIVSASTKEVESKKILMMGGTRFIGIYLARLLVAAGHEVTLFTRGKAPITQQLAEESDEDYKEYASKVKHLQGDRQDFEQLKSKLAASDFDVVYDINGREGSEVEPILDALPNLQQYIFCSSAGVYLKSDLLPHFEVDAVDPKSRHKGKLDTESLLEKKGVNWTSIRPVYIYGPLNYNPVEEWFFHRLKAGRPIPVPGSGLQITQLGHVKDLADAFLAVLGNSKASRQVYNISGAKYVTFDGIAKACAKAGDFPAPEIVHFNAKDFDFGKNKSFPLRDQHFFTSVEKAQAELGWTPKFSLLEGLTDSYKLDFGRGTFRKAPNFAADDMILEKLGKVTVVL